MSTKYLRVVSDLHLEQYAGSQIEQLVEYTVPTDARDAASILVLAGDISSKPTQLAMFIAEVEKRFRWVVYVPGNHEFYKHDMTKWETETRSLLESATEKTSYALSSVLCQQIDGIRFIFGTLWADGGTTIEERMTVARYLNDYRLITIDGVQFTVDTMQNIFEGQKASIEFMLQHDTSGMPNVVVTHHMPSLRLCHPRFGGSANGGFASNLDSVLASDYAPKLWIHGHTHDTIDTKLFNTRIVCNPRGYHKEFDRDVTHQYNKYKVDAKFIEVTEL